MGMNLQSDCSLFVEDPVDFDGAFFRAFMEGESPEEVAEECRAGIAGGSNNNEQSGQDDEELRELCMGEANHQHAMFQLLENSMLRPDLLPYQVPCCVSDSRERQLLDAFYALSAPVITQMFGHSFSSRQRAAVDALAEEQGVRPLVFERQYANVARITAFLLDYEDPLLSERDSTGGGSVTGTEQGVAASPGGGGRASARDSVDQGNITVGTTWTSSESGSILRALRRRFRLRRRLAWTYILLAAAHRWRLRRPPDVDVSVLLRVTSVTVLFLAGIARDPWFNRDRTGSVRRHDRAPSESRDGLGLGGVSSPPTQHRASARLSTVGSLSSACSTVSSSRPRATDWLPEAPGTARALPRVVRDGTLQEDLRRLAHGIFRKRGRREDVTRRLQATVRHVFAENDELSTVQSQVPNLVRNSRSLLESVAGTGTGSERDILVVLHRDWVPFARALRHPGDTIPLLFRAIAAVLVEVVSERSGSARTAAGAATVFFQWAEDALLLFIE